MSKRNREMAKMVQKGAQHTLIQAIDILKKCPPVKFDQSVDVALRLGVDSKKSDQNVRGTVTLPSGTGKQVRTLVLAKGDKMKEAQAAGAEFVGNDDLVEKIASGWTDFDVVIATPDMMRDVGKLGKVLGPRGLMPTPKAGTVTTDLAKAIKEIKGGKIEFKSDRYGIVNCSVGKLSFTPEQLIANIQAFLAAVTRAKPVSMKGVYLQGLHLSSTMGIGVKIDPKEYELSAKG